MQLNIGQLLPVLVVPAGKELAAQQAESVVLLSPREQHLHVVEQQQNTHTEAQGGPLGTDHSIGRSGCTSHDTAEMNSMDCSDHEPANHNRVFMGDCPPGWVRNSSSGSSLMMQYLLSRR